ncbi:hypothetical protein [Synechococcus sp. CBW1107]|uniref:hypothetical protein n=1 Tax=Synechococcus sp. CBW1107 TaxID=2789857 RepID=UPI002AD27D81|nr:hypothetical protein [Synechococcus sp. CBW1107]
MSSKQLSSRLEHQHEPLSRLIRWLDRCVTWIAGGSRSGARMDLRIGSTAFLISVLLASPALWLYLEPGNAGRLSDFIAQADNPLTRSLKEPILGYRILVPLLNYSLGLRGLAVALPAIVASWINLCLCSRIIRLRTDSISLTVYSVVGLSLTFFVVEGTTFWAAPDSVAHLFSLLIAAFSLPWLSWLVAVPLAMLVDERSLVSFLFLGLFCWRAYGRGGDFRLSSPLMNALGLIGGLGVWKLVRSVLDSGLLAAAPVNKVVESQVSRALVRMQPHDGWLVWLLNIAAPFRWMYLFPVVLSALVGIDLLYSKGDWRKSLVGMIPRPSVFWLANLVLFLAWLVASAFNGDVWRTVSFAFFFVIEAVLILGSRQVRLGLALSRVSAILMLATPVVFSGCPEVPNPQIAFPLPLVLWRTFGDSEAGLMNWLRSLL